MGWRQVVWGIALFVATAAVAGGDPRGWTSGGAIAVNADRVLEGAGEAVDIALPKEFAATLPDQALLLYYSPTCPHCQDVAPEIEALDRATPDVPVIWIASGTQSALAVREFTEQYGVTGRVVHDVGSGIAAAMGARSTPSMLRVKRDKKSIVATDAWYPYRPGIRTLVEMRLADDPWAVFTPGRFHGNNTCGACHVDEMASWKLTHHSVAWRTLERGNRQHDAECTSCHVTGAELPGGWTPDSKHSPMVDVGCESCHSAGGPHDGEAGDPRATCAGCHDAKHSIGFTYDKALPLIDHYKAVGMEIESYNARRMALYDGDAPQEMIAFPEGDTVGSAACKRCHEAEHTQWAASPHGAAMASLAPAEATDVACVRCHATPKRTGPPATEVAGFRVDESVGCESCHGPGADHVAAEGGTDNIQGLGESCPVCVLEALCTSCHTKEWDKTWRLEAKLPLVKHLPDD